MDAKKGIHVRQSAVRLICLLSMIVCSSLLAPLASVAQEQPATMTAGEILDGLELVMAPTWEAKIAMKQLEIDILVMALGDDDYWRRDAASKACVLLFSKGTHETVRNLANSLRVAGNHEDWEIKLRARSALSKGIHVAYSDLKTIQTSLQAMKGILDIAYNRAVRAAATAPEAEAKAHLERARAVNEARLARTSAYMEALPTFYTYGVLSAVEDSLMTLSDRIVACAGSLTINEKAALDARISAIAAAISLDSDSDGLPDIWETVMGTDPLSPNANVDADGDGLTDLQEFESGTLPRVADTDGDELPDKWEIDMGTNPRSSDAADDRDNDGLSNLEEYKKGTKPNVADTDGDGANDRLDRYPKDPNKQ